jgi:MFS family permease
MISAVVTAAAVVCRPVTGNLSDRLPKFRLVVAGCAMMLAACLGCAFVPNLGVLVLMRCLHGVGYACCSLGMSTWLTMLLPADKLGSGVGIYGTVSAIAMAIAPTIGLRAKAFWGYRGSFLVAATCALIVIILALLTRDHGMPVAKAEKKHSASRKLVYPRVLPIAIALALITIPYTANKSFLVSYVERSKVAIQPDVFFLLYAGALVVLRTSLSKFFDKVSYAKFLLLGSLSLIASLACLRLMNGPVLLVAAAVFMAGSYGIMYSVSQAATASNAPAEQRGIAMGTFYLGLDFGSAMGPIVGGFLYGSFALNLFYPLLGVFALGSIGMYFVCRKFYGK